MPIDSSEIDAVCDLIHDLCGIALDTSKSYLLESRLNPLLRQQNVTSFADLVTRARSAGDGLLRQQIVDSITTNETLFFRDNTPYEAMKYKAIPETIDTKIGTPHANRLRIWSAACSTGQEPYSVAMVLHEMLPDIHRWDVQILATDVSNTAIAKASKGLFTDLEMDRGCDNRMRDRFFRRVPAGWQAEDSLRALISFRRMNLLEPFRMLGPFDIVLCRNVAIYFRKPQRDDLFHRISRVMTRDGYLFVGASETLGDLGAEFRPQFHCRSTYYRPNLPVATAAH